jgi:hypothetical protein
MVKNGVYSSFGFWEQFHGAYAASFRQDALTFQMGQVQPQRGMGKPTFARSVIAPVIDHPSNCQDLPVKQAQIEPEKAKEELRPLYTNFATP